MSAFDRFATKLKKSESPAARAAKSLVSYVRSPRVLLLPRVVRHLVRPLYYLHFAVILAFRNLLIFYRGPLLQSRCASFGRRVRLAGKLPFINGPVEIHVGNDVSFGGNVTIMSGHLCEEKPRLILMDRSSVSWNVNIVVNKEVVLEEDVWITHDCRISDSEGHRREVDLRLADVPPRPEDFRPVRICRGAWIGNGTHILKGVTIGEGAVIGANSVVMSDVPPFALALGNPAEVLIRGYGKPSTAKGKPIPATVDCPSKPETGTASVSDVQAL